jgi:inner membrane protein
MDNICHTLVGAACSEAGLKRSTRFAAPVLLIAANLPDIDVLAFLSDVPAVALRRGWTHGILAQALLPLAFTGAVMLIDRVWKPPRDRRPARALAVLALSYVGVLSHVFLDWLNTYGVRLLMPLSPRWFHGDSVFIIDPWLWLTFGVGVYLSRRRVTFTPARVALAVATLYIAAMVWSARAARAVVIDAWTRERGRPPHALMVGPAPANPLRKALIVDEGTYYERGTFQWWPARITFDGRRVPRRSDEPEVARAREQDPDMRAVLVWSRFPYYELERVDGGTRVTLRDLRFGARLGSVSAVVPH